MVPNKLVHSGILPLEHERAYARLLGKLEYTFGIVCLVKSKAYFGVICLEKWAPLKL